MPPRHTDQSLPLLNEAELMLDENPNCARTYASFRLTGDALDPEVVTTTLGIKPMRALAKNQAIPTIRRGNGTRRQRTGVWALTSQGIMSSTSLERHLIYLLDAIEPAATPLDTLRVEHNLQADFFCYWLSATGHGGPELSPRTLDRIAALDARLGIDFYGPFDPN